jgi:hypothetical protein
MQCYVNGYMCLNIKNIEFLREKPNNKWNLFNNY